MPETPSSTPDAYEAQAEARIRSAQQRVRSGVGTLGRYRTPEDMRLAFDSAVECNLGNLRNGASPDKKRQYADGFRRLLDEYAEIFPVDVRIYRLQLENIENPMPPPTIQEREYAREEVVRIFEGVNQMPGNWKSGQNGEKSE